MRPPEIDAYDFLRQGEAGQDAHAYPNIAHHRGGFVQKKRDGFRECLSYCAFLLGVLAILYDGAHAQSDDLTIWMIPNELPLATVPTDDDIELFFDSLPQYLNRSFPDDKRQISSAIGVIDISNQFQDDSLFAKSVLGQEQIFRELDEFRRQSNFKAKIKVRFFKWERYLSSLLGAETYDPPPAIVQAPSSWLAALVDKEIIAPLPAQRLGLPEEKYVPSALALCRPGEDAGLYGLPWLIDVRLFFFHRNIFRNPADELDTRNHFENALANAPKEPYEAPFVFPTASDWDLLHQTAMIVWGFDGDILRKENFLGMPFLPLSKAAFGDDKVQDAFEFLRQLTARGLLALPRQNRHAVEGDFLAGEYGSMTSGPWLIRRAFLHYGRDWCDSIGVALPPFGRSNRRSTFLGGSCLSITGFTDGTLDSVALALIDYLTQPQPLLRYTQVTGHLPSSRASLGFDDPVHDSAGPSKQDTYAAYLTRLGARSSVLEVLKDALSVGRSYPSLPDWAEKVEARSTRIGLFNVWQNLAEGEPREVLGFGLESVAQSIDDDLRRVKTNNYYIYVLGALVGLALVSTGCYQSIRWRKRLVSRRSLKQEIDELVESSVKMHERMAELEEQSESSQGNLSQVSEKTRALAEEKEKVDLMLVERERELRSKGMKSKEDSLDDRESTAAGSLSMCRLAEKAWAEYETLTNAGSKANERYIEWGGVVLTEKSALARTKNKAETTAKWSDAVMITGERGTGKSILAKIIHDLSERSGEFKKTNCATIPESLIEDTLFGHVKGAFTGAIRSVQGLLGEASGGTLFLDEITQNRTLQAKILSAMEDKVYRKVGGNEDLYADVRIIVATNRDIFEALSDDALLKDFLDRMGAIQLHVPPLRERRQDIPALLFHFNKLHAVEKQVAPKELASDIVKACVCYSWPGNVRELGTSFFSRIYVLDKLRVELADLPEDEPGENLLQGLREAYDSTFRSSPTPAEMELYTEQFSESLSKLSAELQSQPPSKDMKQKAVAYLSTLKWPESYYQDLANELGPSCAQRVIVWLYESVWLPEYKRLKHGYQTPFREYAFRPLFGVNRKDVVDWHKTLRQS